MKLPTLTSINLIICALLSACASKVPEVASSTLEPIAQIPTVIIRAPRDWPSIHIPYYPVWDPTTNQVMTAVEKIPGYLAQAQKQKTLHPSNFSYLPGLKQRLPKTVCQALGVTIEKKQGILLNFLPAESPWTSDWQKTFIEVYDGGPTFWRVIYLTDSGTFTHLSIDEGY